MEKNIHSSKDIKKTLDNKIFYLTNAEERCVISEKPLEVDIILFHKKDDGLFRYDKVRPELKRESGPFVDK